MPLFGPSREDVERQIKLDRALDIIENLRNIVPGGAPTTSPLAEVMAQALAALLRPQAPQQSPTPDKAQE